MSPQEFSANARRLGLKKYRLEEKAKLKRGYSIDLHATDSRRAWRKFIYIYFGSLKPTRKDWTVREVKAP